MKALLLLFLALLAPLHGADKKLIVGMDLGYPPFEMRDEKGAPAGVSVDLAKALGAHLGQPVEIENIPFSGLILALKTGRIDLIISSMTATAERAQSIDFSESYLKTGLCLLVGARTNLQSITDADRPGQTIAVVKGTTGHLYATQNLKNARVLVLDQPSTCVLEVAQGKVEAFLFDQMSTLQNWRKNPETTRALLTPFQSESWAIGLKKSNEELRGKVNAFLADFRAKGGFENLGDQWLAEQKAEFQKLGVPFVFLKKSIHSSGRCESHLGADKRGVLGAAPRFGVPEAPLVGFRISLPDALFFLVGVFADAGVLLEFAGRTLFEVEVKPLVNRFAAGARFDAHGYRIIVSRGQGVGGDEFAFFFLELEFRRLAAIPGGHGK